MSLNENVLRLRLYTKEYKLPTGCILSEGLMVGYVNKFWYQVYEKINQKHPNSHLAILTKLHFECKEYRSVSHLTHVNITEKDLYLADISAKLENYVSQYFVDYLESISFLYIIHSGEATYYRDRDKDKNKVDEKGYKFNNTILPISPDPEDLGEVLV